MRLRITETLEEDVTVLHVDGELLGEGVGELERLAGTVRPLRLDLGNLLRADAVGLAAIHRLAAGGAELKNVPPYFASLLGGSAGVLIVDQGAITAGASGAVFGLMGAYAVGMWRNGVNPLTTGIGTLLLINLFLTFAIGNISIGGHLGGLVAGSICGAVLLAPRYRPVPNWARWATPVAVGVASEFTEEEVLVVVVPKAGETLEPEALTGHLIDRLAYFMVPRYIRIVDEIPKTETNKPRKVVFREEGITEDTWDREAAGIKLKRERFDG